MLLKSHIPENHDLGCVSCLCMRDLGFCRGVSGIFTLLDVTV